MQQVCRPTRSCDVVEGCPDPRLRPGVLGYRGFAISLDRPHERLEIPAGVVTLVLGFGSTLHIRDATRRPRCTGTSRPETFTSLLAGLSTRARVGRHEGELSGVEVLLEPWAAYSLFGVAMHELVDTLLPPDAVLGPQVDGLVAALAASPGRPERFALLDSVLACRAALGPASSPRLVWAWRELRRTGGMVPIHALVEQSGWSWRQLDSRFREQIGLTPKKAARVLRLRRALGLLAQGRRPARTAAMCGFSDQAHLSREIKTMTGRTPREFLTARCASAARPMSGDRIAGEVTSLVLSG
ncbi:helix-turn-helix domain-containing protein [Streptomyces chrestomyceticus]|uniref:helix-turn-helix domain-containing protein n=1 Tax=Streptomyces chrestomyceticus TaxID=68185 RepID=UPI0033CC0852